MICARKSSGSFAATRARPLAALKRTRESCVSSDTYRMSKRREKRVNHVVYTLVVWITGQELQSKAAHELDPESIDEHAFFLPWLVHVQKLVYGIHMA